MYCSDAECASSPRDPHMKTNLIVLIALFVFPLVALGSGLLAERLMGPRARRKRRTRSRPRADK